MASTRQQKSGRKGLPDPARRGNAWGTGARASPTFSPSSNASRTPNSATPTSQSGFTPLPQTNGARHDSGLLQSLAGLTGTTVVLSTKTSQRYEGVVASTSGEGDTTGVTLKDVKDLTNPGAPLKEHLFIASTNVDTWTSGPADARPSNGDTFRTDTDISQKKGLVRERELQAWQPATDGSSTPSGHADETFTAAGNSSWDQFAVNEKLFGVRTNFDEEVYTTRLDRSGADFKERERKAQRIANEILGTVTTNPHVLEERGHIAEEGESNEEEKYGAVVRGSNAYIPPPARKQAAMASVSASNAPKTEAPKIAVNGPDGAQISNPPSKSSTPAPATAPSSSSTANQPPANKPPADPLPAFRDFVVNEKQRLTQKRQALVRSEMDKKISELVKFGQSFKLNKPIPEDLVPILAKDEEKQRAIREKATQDAQSTQARSIGAPSPANATRGVPANVKPDASRKLTAATAAKTPNVGATQGSSNAIQKATLSAKSTGEASTKKPTISMYIQPIPPFRGSKSRQQGNAPSTTNGAQSTATNAPSSNGSSTNPPPSPSAARLNVNASSFRPNPKASAFTPGANSPNASNSNASLTSSPKPKSDSAPATPNPFFGKQIKKTSVVPLKDDFNPFKHGKVGDPAQTSQLWPYTGKRYNLLFPAPQHPPQPHAPHMVPPGPPPMPPPSYEEDSAAQAAARGYVYAYPPYAYPGQPMMPGMAPPGPPTAYLPGPFMQPMPYPPGMPPPAMYSPAMGQMPPPQAYMPPPPPPGTYPPPNGAGPRPSMPPTPIPAHAHPYYHQSPQMQHAVPYPMMMHPPPNVAPHPYEGGPAPPVQMGGHA